jgi:hypothetical protein
MTSSIQVNDKHHFWKGDADAYGLYIDTSENVKFFRGSLQTGLGETIPAMMEIIRLLFLFHKSLLYGSEKNTKLENIEILIRHTIPLTIVLLQNLEIND